MRHLARNKSITKIKGRVPQAIMKTLLGYIGKERHADSLVEKLMLRFEAAVKPAQWKNLAFCLAQV